MATTTTRANPDELPGRFRTARRMPVMLEVRDQVRTAIRQTSDAMDEEGDSSAELQALFTQLKALLDEIDSRITRQATIDDLDRRASGTIGGSGDATWDRQCAGVLARPRDRRRVQLPRRRRRTRARDLRRTRAPERTELRGHSDPAPRALAQRTDARRDGATQRRATCDLVDHASQRELGER